MELTKHTSTPQRFHKEIQAWSRLKHNNILPFIGVFIDAERNVFLVEPWSQNGDIAHYLRSIRPSADRVALVNMMIYLDERRNC